jgi:hypothetical protein
VTRAITTASLVILTALVGDWCGEWRTATQMADAMCLTITTVEGDRVSGHYETKGAHEIIRRSFTGTFANNVLTFDLFRTPFSLTFTGGRATGTMRAPRSIKSIELRKLP